MEDITRRTFVGTAAAAGAMAAMGMGLGGVQPKAAQAEPAFEDAPLGGTSEDIYAPSGRIDPVKAMTDLTRDELQAMLLDEAEVTEDVTCDDGTVIPALYVRLRNRFNRLGIGIGSQIDASTGAAWANVMSNWTEEEAEAYLAAPLFKLFTVQDYVALTGKSYEDAEAILDQMASHSLISCFERAGVKQYYVLAPLWGMWEFNMDIFDADWCNEFNASLGSDFAAAAVQSVRPLCQIVPVGEEVVDGEMTPYSSWRETLEKNAKFALSPCQCRLEKTVTGANVCADEHKERTETCISVGEIAEFFINRGIGREITREEAIQTVEDSIDAGLVVEQLFSKRSEVICQCHGDCCKLLTTYVALGGAGNMMENISNYTLNYDSDTCVGCGTCVSRCPMFAITINDDGKCEMNRQCVRCGQCALVCPVSARSLVPKPTDQLVELPEDMFDDYKQFSELRMAEGYIVDFVG
jgi:NAD-dependent dihydropyrimidine dehydrogenase PreA subunit